MRILLVEDEDRSERAARQSIEREVPEAVLTVARSRDDAITAVTDYDFDLVLCDIRLPPYEGSADVQEAHGLSVHAECRATCPGTPLIFLTGFATSRDTGDQLAQGGVATVFGIEQSPLVTLIDKGDPERLESRLAELNAGLARVRSIEIVRVDWPSEMFRRAVGLYALEIGHERAEVRMSPGLSGAQVGLVKLSGAGETPAAVFLKVSNLKSVVEEHRRYAQFVSNRLAPGIFAPTHVPTHGGLGGSGALVSTLAPGSKSLFELAARNPEAAASVVRRLQSGLLPWTATARQSKLLTLADIRRLRLSDQRLEGSAEAKDLARHADGHSVVVHELICHGDLHGENVLVSPEDDRPVLIDFGDTGPGYAPTDPVTLELSLLYHRDGPAREGAAGSGLNWSEWANVDRFASGAPLEPFIHAVRDWALEVASQDAILAFAYAHSLRQIKYADVDHGLAFKVARSAIAGLGL